jgi:hypothetical protein
MKVEILLSTVLVAAGCICAVSQVGPQPFTLAVGIEGPVAGIEAPHVVKAASDLSIRITTFNHSKHELSCSTFVDAVTGLDATYEYDIRDSQGTALNKKTQNGPKIGSLIGSGCKLKPGESMTGSSRLTKAYDLRKPGKYTIQLARPRSENGDINEGTAKSNVLVVTVTDDDSAIDKATPRFALLIAAYSNGRPSTTDVPFVVKSGEDVGINIVKKVTSKYEVDCSIAWSSLSGLDERYQYDVRDSAGIPVPKREILTPLPWANQASGRICRPGEADGGSGNNSISRIYSMSRPGNYTIQVSQPASQDPANGVVKSNVIMVKVTP